MSEARKALLENIIEPAAYGRSTSVIKARVLEIDEPSNTCKIGYRDKYGKTNEKERIHVKLYNVSIVDWFPKKGDLVLVDQNEDNFVITGPHANSYQSLKMEKVLKQDVLTDTFIDMVGGFIF